MADIAEALALPIEPLPRPTPTAEELVEAYRELENALSNAIALDKRRDLTRTLILVQDKVAFWQLVEEGLDGDVDYAREAFPSEDVGELINHIEMENFIRGNDWLYELGRERGDI